MATNTRDATEIVHEGFFPRPSGALPETMSVLVQDTARGEDSGSWDSNTLMNASVETVCQGEPERFQIGDSVIRDALAIAVNGVVALGQ